MRAGFFFVDLKLKPGNLSVEFLQSVFGRIGDNAHFNCFDDVADGFSLRFKALFEQVQSRVVVFQLYVQFINADRNSVDLFGIVQQFNRVMNHQIFKVLLGDRLDFTFLLSEFPGTAGVIIVSSTGSGSSADADHPVFAISADQSPRENETALLFLAARRLFVFVGDGADSLPKIVGDDSGEDVIIYHALPCSDAGIDSIVQQFVEICFADRAAVFLAITEFLEKFGDQSGIVALCVKTERLTDDIGFIFVDDVTLIHDVIAEDRTAAGGFSFSPTLFKSAIYLLTQFCGVVLVHTLQETFKDDPFRSIGDVFHSGNQFHAVLFQSMLVDRRLVLVAGEPVKLIDENDLPLMLGTVQQHTLKIRAHIVGSRHSTVDIGIHDQNIICLGIVFTDAQLSFDRLLALAIAAVTSIDNCFFHYFSPFSVFCLSTEQKDPIFEPPSRKNEKELERGGILLSSFNCFSP